MATPVCKYYQATKECFYGDSCPFSHAAIPQSSSASVAAANTTSATATSAIPSTNTQPISKRHQKPSKYSAKSHMTSPSKEAAQRIVIQSQGPPLDSKPETLQSQPSEAKQPAAPVTLSSEPKVQFAATSPVDVVPFQPSATPVVASRLAFVRPAEKPGDQSIVVDAKRSEIAEQANFAASNRKVDPSSSAQATSSAFVPSYPVSQLPSVAPQALVSSTYDPQPKGSRFSQRSPGTAAPTLQYAVPGRGGSAHAPIVSMAPNVQPVFPSSLPHALEVMQGGRATFFVSDALKTDLMQRQLSLLQQNTPTGSDDTIPTEVSHFFSLVPLDATSAPEPSNFFLGNSSMVYKVFGKSDGLPYCLRRMAAVRWIDQKAIRMVDRWKALKHANIVAIHEAFTTKEFRDNSLVIVYDFVPSATTLLHRHFASHASPIPEQLLWSYIIQLTSALHAVHTAGLTCRIIDLTKIIVTGKSRLYLSGVGILDMLDVDRDAGTPAYVIRLQQEDFMRLGYVILQLACGRATISRDQHSQSLNYVATHYTEDVTSLLRYLFAMSPNKSVVGLMPMIGVRFYSEIDSRFLQTDVLEHDLTKELYNGRLFRIMCKLQFVAERRDAQRDRRGETSDSYLLSLLQHYIFHQVTDTQTAWADMSHVVQCLNKLDVGSAERITLVSRDEKNVMIVSYHDLKRALQVTFQDLAGSAFV